MTHNEKLAAAIAWLRERNHYVLDPKSDSCYQPAYGFPLAFAKGQ